MFDKLWFILFFNCSLSYLIFEESIWTLLFNSFSSVLYLLFNVSYSTFFLWISSIKALEPIFRSLNYRFNWLPFVFWRVFSFYSNLLISSANFSFLILRSSFNFSICWLSSYWEFTIFIFLFGLNSGIYASIYLSSGSYYKTTLL